MSTFTDHLLATVRDPMALSIREARAILGRTHVLAKPESNKKLSKGQKRGWMTSGLSLAPHSLAGLPTVCPRSTPQCRAFCVAGSGNAIAFSSVMIGRIGLTRLLYEHPNAFIRVLVDDLVRYQAKARREGFRFAARLNVFSDIEWERVSPVIFETAAQYGIPLYDYTKVITRTVPVGYTLTWSHSEVNRLAAAEIPNGVNVAIPFEVVRGHPLPSHWNGRPVVDGDASDLRFLDPSGVVVGLRSKVTKAGKATSTGGFALRVLQ